MRKLGKKQRRWKWVLVILSFFTNPVNHICILFFYFTNPVNCICIPLDQQFSKTGYLRFGVNIMGGFLFMMVCEKEGIEKLYLVRLTLLISLL